MPTSEIWSLAGDISQRGWWMLRRSTRQCEVQTSGQSLVVSIDAEVEIGPVAGPRIAPQMKNEKQKIMSTSEIWTMAGDIYQRGWWMIRRSRRECEVQKSGQSQVASIDAEVEVVPGACAKTAPSLKKEEQKVMSTSEIWLMCGDINRRCWRSRMRSRR